MAQKLEAQLQGDEGEIWGAQDIEAFVDHEPENEAVTLHAKNSDNRILARIKYIIKNRDFIFEGNRLSFWPGYRSLCNYEPMKIGFVMVEADLSAGLRHDN